MSEHKLAVLLLCNEGFRQVDGGVARYVHNILDTARATGELAARSGFSLSWHVAERALCTGVDVEKFEHALDRYVRSGVTRFHSIADPRVNGAEEDHFEHCVALGAAAGQVMTMIAEEVDSVLVIGGMSMYGMAPRFVIRAADQFGIPVSYVHMTHNPVLRPLIGDAELPGTYADSVMGHLARYDERVTVGWESYWMREQYQTVYGIPDDKVVFARAGVPLSDPKFVPQDQEHIEALLESLGVPTDRDLVVSWGRGIPDKGFELLVESAHADGEQLLPVVLNPRPNARLAELVHQLGSDAVLLHGQGDEVVSALCQWRRTRCAAFLSEGESASVAPVEAALMSGSKGTVVLVVPTGVYPELITDGENGIVTDERSAKAVAQAFRRVRELGDDERVALSRAADLRARREHDFEANWLRSFDEMLRRHLALVAAESR